MKPRTTLVRVKMRMRLTDGNVFTVAIALLAGIVLASMRTDAALLEPAPGDHEESMKFGGYDRTFQVHVPPPRLDGSSKLPVVMMLHGAGGSAKGAARDTGWSIEADKDGFLAVYPEALPGRTALHVSFLANPRLWNDGSGRGRTAPTIDDTGFLAAVMDDLIQSYDADPRRISVPG